jgi:hypothetical protein
MIKQLKCLEEPMGTIIMKIQQLQLVILDWFTNNLEKKDNSNNI